MFKNLLCFCLLRCSSSFQLYVAERLGNLPHTCKSDASRCKFFSAVFKAPTILHTTNQAPTLRQGLTIDYTLKKNWGNFTRYLTYTFMVNIIKIIQTTTSYHTYVAILLCMTTNPYRISFQFISRPYIDFERFITSRYRNPQQ